MLKAIEESIIWGMLFALVVPFVCFFFIDYFEKGNLRPPENSKGMKVLSVHRSVYYFGLSLFLFFLGAMCFSLLIEQKVNLNWLFIAPISIGALITIHAITFQVTYNDEVIRVRTALGKAQEYKINDLKFVEFNEYAGWHIYQTPDGKTLRFSTVLTGIHDLIRTLKRN